MDSEDTQGRTRDVREKIAQQMRSIGQARRKSLPDEDLQKLRIAANRLDQMLKASANADRDILRNAAQRLDQLLNNIRNGSDVTARLKRQRDAPENKANDSR